MSDKNTYNKDFVNQGWENMSSILDKEMPVKKKKRRFLFWIFFTGIIACGGGLMWYSLHSTNPIDITSEEIAVPFNGIKKHSNTQANIYPEIKSDLIKHNPIVEKEIIGGNKIAEMPKIQEVNSFIGEKEITDKVNVHKKENNATTQYYNLNYNIQTLKNNKAIRHLFFDDSRSEKETTIIEIKEGEIESLRPRVFKNELKETSVKPKPNKSTKEEVNQKEKANEVKPIAFSDIDYIGFFEKETLPFKPKSRRWEFGLEAGFVFQNKNELGGKLGFVASNRFRPKWTFHTGLEYNVQFVNYSVSEQEDLNLIMDPDFTTGGVPAVDGFENLELNPIKLNSHFVKIPILIGYKFNRSFEITAGILGSSLVFSGEGRKSASLEEAIVVVPNYSNVSSEKITPAFDIQTSIGMTYYPNKKWGINLRYDNGFLQRKVKYEGSAVSDLGLIKGYNSRNRQLSLSARMYF